LSSDFDIPNSTTSDFDVPKFSDEVRPSNLFSVIIKCFVFGPLRWYQPALRCGRPTLRCSACMPRTAVREAMFVLVIRGPPLGERSSESVSERERERESQRECQELCVCMCVFEREGVRACVCARELECGRERECVCESACVRESESAGVRARV